MTNLTPHFWMKMVTVYVLSSVGTILSTINQTQAKFVSFPLFFRIVAQGKVFPLVFQFFLFQMLCIDENWIFDQIYLESLLIFDIMLLHSG